MNEAQVKQLVAIFQKLTIFKGLTPEEIQRLLRVCKLHRYGAGEQVYRCGDPADEMFLLIQGGLSVLSPAGAELAEITPGMTIGEMGLFADQPRSADIVTRSPTLGFGLSKPELEGVLKINREMMIKVQQNVIRLLVGRLQETNLRLDRYGDTIERLQDRIEKLAGEFEDPGEGEEEGGDKGEGGPAENQGGHGHSRH